MSLPILEGAPDDFDPDAFKNMKPSKYAASTAGVSAAMNRKPDGMSVTDRSGSQYEECEFPDGW